MADEKNVHAGHRERLRNRYAEFGAGALASHEMLELLLFYAIPRRDTNELAHMLLDHFDGSLARVLAAPCAELENVEGIGHSTAVLIKLAFDIVKKSETEKNACVRYLLHISDIGNFLIPFFSNVDNEIVMFVALDPKMRLISCVKIFEGTFSSALIDMKKLVEKAVTLRAAYVVVAHNHPSGNALPSDADMRSTSVISSMLGRLGITLMDHLIFADDDYVSLSQSNLLETEDYAHLAVNDNGATASDECCVLRLDDISGIRCCQFFSS